MVAERGGLGLWCRSGLDVRRGGGEGGRVYGGGEGRRLMRYTVNVGGGARVGGDNTLCCGCRLECPYY